VPAGADTARESGVEDFGGLTVRHRGRTGLTQRQLAARLGVHVRTIQDWEAGHTHPATPRLKPLIAVYLEAGGFAEAHELAEAQALWAAALADGARFENEGFDSLWFAHILSERPALARRDALPHWRDWGDAPDAARFVNRDAERAVLRQWVLEERSRLVGVVGLGGVGKTLVATRVAQELAPMFERVCWRSLRNAPTPAQWLADVIAFVSVDHELVSDDEHALLGQLLDLLRQTRSLLVLDNLESVLEPRRHEGHYRTGYEGYGRLLRQLGESWHQSCLILTSREEPPEMATLCGEGSPVRVLRLGGLGADDGRNLLQDKQLSGDDLAWQQLVARYEGNALALRVVGARIRELFGGAIRPFLQYTGSTSGTSMDALRLVLDTQFERLSELERTVLQRLAVEREALTMHELAAELRPAVDREPILEAAAALRRRSLLEPRLREDSFSLPSVILEYVTERLVDAVTSELTSGQLRVLKTLPLIKATAKDFVRRNQERLIGAPILERLLRQHRSNGAVEQHLIQAIERLRGEPLNEQGYAPGSLVNLLRLLRGDLRGVDLSGLFIRGAYLQEVNAQGASLAGASLAESVLASAFDEPVAVALDRDGEWLAVGTLSGEVRAWHMPDRTGVLAVTGHVGTVPSVALSGDGRLLASAGLDGRVKLWALPTARLVADFDADSTGVWGVALSADGRLMASGGGDSTVKLWAPESNELLRKLEGHTAMVTCVGFSADGALVASSSMDGTVKVWETAHGRLRHSLVCAASGVWGVGLSADGRLVAGGGLDGTVTVWDTASGREVASLRGHTACVRGVVLTPDGMVVVSSSFDRSVRVWQVATGELLATLSDRAPMNGIALSGAPLPTGGWLLAAASQDGMLSIWDSQSRECLARLRGAIDLANCLALSGDGRLAATASVDGTLRLWAPAAQQLLATLAGHVAGVWELALSADGQVLVSASLDGTVRLWDTGSGRAILTVAADPSGAWTAALSPDGRLLASGGGDGTVKVWDARDGRLLRTTRGHDGAGAVMSVAFGCDGRLIASAGMDGAVRVWEASSGRLLCNLVGHVGGVRGVAVSADGRRVISGGLDGTIRVWAIPRGAELARLAAHTAGVWGVALSADGRSMASGGGDGTVKLWQVERGELMATLVGHSGTVLSVAMTTDAQQVASGGTDGTLRLWRTSDGSAVQTLRPDRCYERLDITGVAGLTEAQRQTLFALGAREGAHTQPQ
jgi:WD40 repeat protein/transcriptional regulator with XRE-family HTH domain